jgi:Fe-S cluster assembly protein SufD
MTASEIFRPAFEAALQQAHDAVSVRDLRQAAYARFVALGLPTTHDEDWKYTSLSPLSRARFTAPKAAANVTLDDLKPLTFGVLGRHRAVFVDGRLVPSLSTLDSLPAGVAIASYGKAVIPSAASVIPSEARDLPSLAEMSDAFNALNLALANDGALVGVSPGVVVGEPLYLYFYATRAAGDAPAVAVRNTIVMPRGSQVKVVEAYGGALDARYFTSAFTNVTLEDGAVVDHVKLQRESTAAFHVARLNVLQGRSTRFSDFTVNLGAALNRNDIEVRFDGEGGECSLDGLFMATGEQHTDTHTLIDHARPRCTSRELYKGVLDGKARGVFHGRILVRKDAQKTDAHQSNKNLLLSREALVNSTPQLEILADDVKCKHGSTTGQLDATALFYLRSRGISEAAARGLLTYAFASDLVQRIPLPDVRAGLEAYLQAHLRGAGGVEEAVA